MSGDVLRETDRTPEEEASAVIDGISEELILAINAAMRVSNTPAAVLAAVKGVVAERARASRRALEDLDVEVNL
ncbi:hypothetical protein HY604_05140 [Candidatus Peregrinibacteria bacterium]|nr:hypothetical protein [Candidatus Peregrinibacteria bacterium]